MWRFALALSIVAVTAGCPANDGLTCVDGVDLTTCPPLYAPTWANVYDNTIARSCAGGGFSCHATIGAQGGLVLEGDRRAFESLTTDHRYVIPGEPACSPLIERLYTTDRSFLMPRGMRLPDPEACAVARWVAAGAPGPVELIDAGTDAAPDAAAGSR